MIEIFEECEDGNCQARTSVRKRHRSARLTPEDEEPLERQLAEKEEEMVTINTEISSKKGCQ